MNNKERVRKKEFLFYLKQATTTLLATNKKRKFALRKGSG